MASWSYRIAHQLTLPQRSEAQNDDNDMNEMKMKRSDDGDEPFQPVRVHTDKYMYEHKKSPRSCETPNPHATPLTTQPAKLQFKCGQASFMNYENFTFSCETHCCEPFSGPTLRMMKNDQKRTFNVQEEYDNRTPPSGIAQDCLGNLDNAFSRESKIPIRRPRSTASPSLMRYSLKRTRKCTNMTSLKNITYFEKSGIMKKEKTEPLGKTASDAPSGTRVQADLSAYCTDVMSFPNSTLLSATPPPGASVSRGAVGDDKGTYKTHNELFISATDYKDQVQSLRRNWCCAHMARRTSTQRDATITDTMSDSGGGSENDDGYTSSSCSSVSFTSSDDESWLVDTGATGHYGDWGKEQRKGSCDSYRPSTNMIVGIGNKQMHAAAEGDPGPLKDATFYKFMGNNLIGAQKLCEDSKIGILLTADGMSLLDEPAVKQLIQGSHATKLCRATETGLYKVRLSRLEKVLRRVEAKRKRELAALAEKNEMKTAMLVCGDRAMGVDDSPSAHLLQRAHLCEVMRQSGWNYARENGEDPWHELNEPLEKRLYNSPPAKLTAAMSAKYGMKMNDDRAQLADYKPASEILLLHQRMGHANLDDMKHAIAHGITYGTKVTLKALNALHQLHCRQCPLGKLIRASFPKKTKQQRLDARHDTILGRIGSDTVGPRTEKSLVYQDRFGHLKGGNAYWQVYCDDKSKFLWGCDFKRKSDLPSEMKFMEDEMAIDAASSVDAPAPGGVPLRVQCYRTDNAGELTSKKAVKEFHKRMIKRELSVPDCSIQNALAETAILIIQNKTRMLLVDAKLGIKYTMLAKDYAILIINCGRCVANPEGKSRWELFYGHAPDTSQLKTWGAEVWIHLPIKQRVGKDKQSPNGLGGNGRFRFVGIPRGTKGYMILDLHRKPHPRILIRRDVLFQEDMEHIHAEAESSDSYSSDSTMDGDSETDSTNASSLSSSPYDTNDTDSSLSDTASTAPTSDSSDSSSDESEPDQGGANSPLGPNCDQPMPALIPLVADSDSDSENSYSSSSDTEDSDEFDESRGKLITTMKNDTLRKIAGREDCDPLLLQSLNLFGGKEVPLSAKFQLHTELYLPSEAEATAFNLPGLFIFDGSASEGGSAADSENYPEPEQEHDSDGASSDAAALATNEQRAISHAQGALNLAAFMAEFKDPEANDENDYMTLDEIESAQLKQQLEQAALHAGMPPDSVVGCSKLGESLEQAYQLAAEVASYSQLKGATGAEKRQNAKKLKQMAKNQFFRGGEKQHAYLVKKLTHLKDVNLVPDPKTIAEALGGDFEEFWREAILAELKQMEDMKVWQWAHLPKGRKAMDTKWVLKVKRNYDGFIDRFKARLVGRGFKGILGIDYWKTHASVVRKSTLRLLIAHAARHDLKYQAIDIKAAFLEADIDRKVYIIVEGPGIPGCTPPEPGMVRCLNKSLYGIKQAPRQWMLQMMEDLLRWGFVQHRFDPCLFMYRQSATDYCLVCLYVDDMSMTYKGEIARQHFLHELNQRYTCSQSDDRDVYLGIRIRRTAPGHYSMDQERYTVTLLKKYGCKIHEMKTRFRGAPSSDARRKVPLTKAMCPTTEKEKADMAKLPYRQIIGSLRHLEQWTRPDIATALNVLSSFQANPGRQHHRELMFLLSYVNNTRNLALNYGATCNPAAKQMGHDVSGPLSCFVDADWGTEKETRRSRTGYVFFSNNGPVAWRSRLQVTQALSTCEAEFMAASDAACMNAYLRFMQHDIQEVIEQGELKYNAPTKCWGDLSKEDFDPLQLPRVFSEAELPIMRARLEKRAPPTTFHEDNMGAISTANNPTLHDRMKHVDIRWHRLRSFISIKQLRMLFCPTDDQLGDCMTKNLNIIKFYRFRPCMVQPTMTPPLT